MKTALVLSGGGARGAFQIGVLEHLIKEKKYSFDSMYGTSVGALNTSGLSMLGYDELRRIWDNIKKMSDIFASNWYKLWVLFGDGLYNYKPLEKLLHKHLDGKSASVPVTVTKVHIPSGKLVYAKSDEPDFVESVLASTLVPLAADPYKGLWYDGGVREITPLQKAIDDGAEKIVVILCSPYNQDPDAWRS